ncbi:MAG TPA: phosphate ABC transporter permease PstA [Lentisphaeria bacterium]|jgi:phosphate transport system permease protein|nr:MAG: Phosphate transport system permease protein PstA [Lentisphaerae bacterium ADurb.Bin082]HPY90290.1 phosphate ABC transporter permease PstA [Lentisphaeria bacterium]HQC51550.1 phosphate ABC transporter permease PstA [Lentisphaeria bacterium]HQL87907.1 phosphate ABC transporter permease PstA [Lentisphaeria bacterium]
MKKKTIFFRKSADRLVRIASGLAVAVAVAVMFWIIFTVFRHGSAALKPSFFINPSKPYGIPDGGIANALIGTVFITFGAAVLATPPALLGGICLSEYKEFRRFNATLRFAANVMMGMPSVIVGLFVYTSVVVPTGNFSGLAGSIALAIIMFPVIMRTTEDMLGMVPYALRESALALGLTRTRTTVQIVCRSARKGLLTGILLALSRVSGETAPLLFTALFADRWPWGYFNQPTANLPVLITEYSTNSPFAEMHRAGWGAALVVTVLVLAINVATRIIFREKKHGH